MPVLTFRSERIFIVYAVEIVKFVEYCKRYGVTEDLDIKYIVPSVQKINEDRDDDIRTGDYFLCRVRLESDKDVLRFLNIFSLFFNVSKSPI